MTGWVESCCLLCHRPSEVASPLHSSEDSVWTHQETRVTFAPSPHLPAQTQTPGGGRSGHICSSARHWSLTKQHLGQAAPTPPPARTAACWGAAGLPQTWPRCPSFFPLAPGLFPIEREREREQMRPFQRQHRALVAENCSCPSTFHTGPGVEETKMPADPATAPRSPGMRCAWRLGSWQPRLPKSRRGCRRKGDWHNCELQTENKPRA